MVKAQTLLLHAIFILSVLCSCASDLDVYRQKYEASMEEIIFEHGTKMIDFNNEYMKALEDLEEKIQKPEYWDAMKILIREKERFKSTKAMPETTSRFVNLRKIQESFIEKLSGLETEYSNKIITLAEQYSRALGSLRSSLISSGKMEEAVNVQEAEKEVLESQTYLTAKQKLKELATADQEAVKPSAVHPADAVGHEGHWYKIFDEPLDWTAARARCEEMGGNLVSIELEAERQVLAELAKERILWVGATDEKEEGKFLWLSGKEMVPLVSNNSEGSDFVYMTNQGKYSAKANKANSVYKNRRIAGFICEWDK